MANPHEATAQLRASVPAPVPDKMPSREALACWSRWSRRLLAWVFVGLCLSGKVVLVTGATFASEGAGVGVLDIDAERAPNS